MIRSEFRTTTLAERAYTVAFLNVVYSLLDMFEIYGLPFLNSGITPRKRARRTPRRNFLYPTHHLITRTGVGYTLLCDLISSFQK